MFFENWISYIVAMAVMIVAWFIAKKVKQMREYDAVANKKRIMFYSIISLTLTVIAISVMRFALHG